MKNGQNRAKQTIISQMCCLSLVWTLFFWWEWWLCRRNYLFLSIRSPVRNPCSCNCCGGKAHISHKELDGIIANVAMRCCVWFQCSRHIIVAYFTVQLRMRLESCFLLLPRSTNWTCVSPPFCNTHYFIYSTNYVSHLLTCSLSCNCAHMNESIDFIIVDVLKMQPRIIHDMMVLFLYIEMLHLSLVYLLSLILCDISAKLSLTWIKYFYISFVSLNADICGSLF